MGSFFRGELKTPLDLFSSAQVSIFARCLGLRSADGAYAQARNEYNAGAGQEELA
jgi:hypothetical protein